MGLRSQLAATSGGAPGGVSLPAPVPAPTAPVSAPGYPSASSYGAPAAPAVPVAAPASAPVPSAPPMAYPGSAGAGMGGYPAPAVVVPPPSAPAGYYPSYPPAGAGSAGAPAVAPVPAAGVGAYYGAVLNVLRSNVAENHLEPFYPMARLELLAQECAKLDWASFARERGLTLEVALDYCALALYNLTFLMDDSGSMSWDAYGKPTHDPEKQRWSDAIAFLQEAVKIGVKFDADGVDIAFLNSPKVLAGAKAAAEVEGFMRTEVLPSGGTPLVQSLGEKVLTPYMGILSAARGDLTRIKPMMVYVGTDGAPTEGCAEGLKNFGKMMKAAQDRMLSMGAPAFSVKYSFIQIGRDGGGAEMLDGLDRDPTVGDFVDTTSDFEVEAEQFLKRNPGSRPISVWEYFAKALLGSVWKKYDSLD
jgi:hypothetical protein